MSSTDLARLQVVTHQDLRQLLTAPKMTYDQQPNKDQSTTHTKQATAHDR
jgi:hypothetical protein